MCHPKWGFTEPERKQTACHLRMKHLPKLSWERWLQRILGVLKAKAPEILQMFDT